MVFVCAGEFLIMLKKIITFSFVTVFCFHVLGCAHSSKSPNPSLYEQLGKYEGIDALVLELIYVLAEDERVRDRYKGVNMDKFKKGLSDYICSIASGSCEYSGDSLKVIHAGHQYTDTEFNALVGDLIKAMNRKKIPVATQNQLLSLLAPSYKDIIYH